MKIVHTADWHVGKTLRGKHRGDEHREALLELSDFIREKGVELLVVSGDLFDSVAPSAEAEEIVYNFFRRVSQSGASSVVIAGNHDSAHRFKAVSYLLSLANVMVLGFPAPPDKGGILELTSKTHERVVIALLPFVPERMFMKAEEVLGAKEKETQCYVDKIKELISQFPPFFHVDTINLLSAHILISGARPGAGERRLFLGENYAIPSSVLPAGLQYIALGHIHRQQEIKAASPSCYCGSIIQLDFGETEDDKGFLYLEASPGKPASPVFIPLKAGKKLVDISGTVEEIYTTLQINPALKDAYLRITVRSNEPAAGLAHKIRKDLPGALEIRRERTESQLLARPNLNLGPIDLYYNYYEKSYNHSPSPSLLAEFRRLYEEESSEQSQNETIEQAQP